MRHAPPKARAEGDTLHIAGKSLGVDPTFVAYRRQVFGKPDFTDPMGG